MSSTFIRSAVVALGAAVALGGVAWGASSMSTASAETPAVTKRVDGDDAVVLVADDDDDDAAGARDGATNTRGEATRSQERTHSRNTGVSRDQDLSRADNTQDRTRDRSADRTDDRSKNDTRLRRS